ncbi:MAG: aldo/keto reductase [Halobacteriales archaeon]|nr:aldo/keto reductase [Halobacteriales archaeon]
MQTRPLGTTGQESSVLTFGSIALDYLEQPAANEMVEDVLDAGVNHFDVAPQYGSAEVKLAPKLQAHREEVFLGCKTLERTRSGARSKLERSLDRLGVDRIDLYQFHAVTEESEIETIFGDDGALEAVLAAREEGLIEHIGLTSHGDPRIIRKALERFDFDTVMFPLNFVLWGREDAAYDYASLLEYANANDIGTIAIKAFAKGPWPDDIADKPAEERPYATWYEPFEEPDMLEECLRFVLSQNVTTITSAGDPRLVPPILEAAKRFEPMDEAEQAAMIEHGHTMDTPVPRT